MGFRHGGERLLWVVSGLGAMDLYGAYSITSSAATSKLN